MNDSLLTKCPHCQTLFRIQQEHLAAAGGEVRCGVCYKVFDAENEGLAYSQGEGSPAEKTFATKTDVTEDSPAETTDKVREESLDEAIDNALDEPLDEPLDSALDKAPNEAPEGILEEEVIDTSPEPGPQQTLNAAGIILSANEQAPSTDEIQQLQISSSSVSEIVDPENHKSQRPSLKWAALSMLALLGLFCQWLWINFEDKAHDPKWQVVYSNVCQTLGCELPSYRNISEIKTERLAIKTHPDYSNVLIVDMIINNSSPHTQALPVLDMAFFTINGEPLAQRLLQPEEYLSQRLKQLPLMPSQTPIHLSFAILDPGDKAVNYSINLAPAS